MNLECRVDPTLIIDLYSPCTGPLDGISQLEKCLNAVVTVLHG